MKKIVLFCVAAAALVLSASCNKGGSSSSVVLPAAKYTADAKKLLLDESSQSNPGIKSIEFTESGRYIVCRRVIKAVEEVEFLHGTYTVSNNEYILNGLGTVTVAGNQVTIQMGDDNIVVTYTEAEKYPENEFYTTIARAWKVDKTDISVTINGSNVGVVKNGCDIPAILKELEGKANVDLKDDKMAGYVVSEINFTLSKTMEVAFNGEPSRSPVAGPISLSADGSFSYVLSGAANVDVLSGSATGTIDTNPGLVANQILLSVNAEVTSESGKTYNGRVSFILSPKAS